MLKWIELKDPGQVEAIKKLSSEKCQVIFKHSTRCSTSSVVKNRLERSEADDRIDFYLLDLISYRAVSNEIAETFNVYHESPQVLVIRNGECIYDESHYGITMEDIIEQSSPSKN